MRKLAAASLATLFFCIARAVVAAAPADVAVRVQVRTAAGKALSDAYVGLTPSWRPASDPIAETIAKSGTAVLHVPAGRYRVTAGARGFAVAVSNQTLSPLARNHVVIELHPLVPVTGSIVGDSGVPIEGARVAMVNGAVPAPFDVLSELAARHLGADFSAIANDGGAWTLGLPPGTVPLLIEAPGRAPSWRTYRADDPSALNVALLPGARLRVTMDRTDPDLIVTLIRDGATERGGVPREWQSQIWARRATDGSLEWDSLSGGDYSVYARYPDPHFLMPRAEKLATVTLTAGESRKVAVKLPPSRRRNETMAWLVEDVPWKDLHEGIEAFAIDASGTVKKLEYGLEDAIGGSIIHLDAVGTHGPVAVLTADRMIAPAPEAERGDVASVPLRTVVHARADANLQLRAADPDARLPRLGMAVARDCAKGKRIEVPVDVRGGGLARFTAPAGCHAVVLSFDPFESIVIEKPLLAGTQELGGFILRAGATADVRIVREPNEAIVPGAAVRVIAASDVAPDRDAVIVAESRSGDDGWAHFAGLPVFRDLRFAAETRERETSAVEERRLAPREHATIDPLPIPKPGELVVDAKIAPTFLARFPAARVAVVFLRPDDARREAAEKRQEILREKTAPLHFAGLHPGKWLLNALLEIGGIRAIVDAAVVELRAGETRNVALSLEPLVFEGRLTSAGEGVAARMTIQDPSASPRSFMQMVDSEQDGSFRVLLPQPGTYSVEVARLRAQGNSIPLGDVEFTDPARVVQLQLPSTAALNVHVTAGGRPSEHVSVRMTSRRETAGRLDTNRRARITDVRGETAFDDLVPGLWTVEASDERQERRASKTVTLQRDENAAIELDLATASMVEGVIRDAAGVPLPRVRVQCLAGHPMPETASADTDANGTFGLELPPDSTNALCSVTSPMGAVDAFRAVAGQRVDMSLRSTGVGVEISDWGTRRVTEMYWLIADDGRAIGLSSVASRIGRAGGPLSIAVLPAVRWKIVRVESLAHWVALGEGLGASLPVVVELPLGGAGRRTVQLFASSDSRNGSE